MIKEHRLPKYFWDDAINTTCYVLNRVLIRPILNKTPYEIFKGRNPNISHFHLFKCKCSVLYNGKENLGKFDSKVDEGIFLGYSQSSKAYRVFNKILHIVEESVHVSFDESDSKLVGKGSVYNGAGVSSESILQDPKEKVLESTKIEEELDKVSEERKEDHPSNKNDLHLEWKSSRDHPVAVEMFKTKPLD